MISDKRFLMDEVLCHSCHRNSIHLMLQALLSLQHFLLVSEERVNVLWCQSQVDVTCEVSPEA